MRPSGRSITQIAPTVYEGETIRTIQRRSIFGSI
jgi:hypothetical protein